MMVLDHDADAEVHEWFAEVDDSFALWWDRQRSYRQVGLLPHVVQTHRRKSPFTPRNRTVL